MKHNTFLVKPASSLCDLRCRYCFYDDVSSSRACKNMGLLSHEMARELIEKAFAATEDGGSVHFLFQGGEPTLAGLDFFRFFLETERSLKRSLSVFHSIQTNGIGLNEAWASFFKANSFLVGLSLDGTQEVHDLYRLVSWPESPSAPSRASARWGGTICSSSPVSTRSTPSADRPIP